jgi:hypothetical protein
MFNPFAKLEEPVPDYLQELLAITKKSALEKFCRQITITQHHFAVLVWNAATIGYQHVLQNHEFQPEHLLPTQEEIAGLGRRSADGKISDEGQRFLRKIGQLFKDRRILVSHMFFNSARWHLFYFDQRDLAEEGSQHWKQGTHVHFVNDLWPQYDPSDLWTLLKQADASIGGKLHIRFEHTTIADESAPLP